MVKVDLRFIGPDEESFGRIDPHENMLLDGFRLMKITKNKIYLTVEWGR